ncbi:MAG: hypothetical protein Q7R39_02995, partial [Dehalococcoidia bacterium]|nr:hypothetical protein [Dehalococcoidia bacterium]
IGPRICGTQGYSMTPFWATAPLDRLANASYQIVIEGTSYRERLSPHRRKEVLTVRPVLGAIYLLSTRDQAGSQG